MIKEAKKFGNSSAHIIIPKKYIGQIIELNIPSEPNENTYLTKKEIKTLILEIAEDIVTDASGGRYEGYSGKFKTKINNTAQITTELPESPVSYIKKDAQINISEEKKIARADAHIQNASF